MIAVLRRWFTPKGRVATAPRSEARDVPQPPPAPNTARPPLPHRTSAGTTARLRRLGAAHQQRKAPTLVTDLPDATLDAEGMARLDTFLGAADFYGDGDHLYVTDGDRLFVLAIGGQDWGQLDAWPPGRRLHEMPREAFEAILGARPASGVGLSRWRGCDAADRRNLKVLALLADRALKGGDFVELHIPAAPGPELYLLLTHADWAAVLAGRALSLANVCEVSTGDLRLYRFAFNATGAGALDVVMEEGAAFTPVFGGGWHDLATRPLSEPAPP